MHNNRTLNVKRMEGLRTKFEKDPSLFKLYCGKINEYIANEYAVKVPEDCLSATDKTNYIPHHCTSVHTKFRVVFDCSARYKSLCLNDLLLEGPNLTNNLIGVLLRFKQYPVAFVADIRHMFSQVFVDKGDRDALRFLWFAGNDFTQPLVEYQMQTHVFGATCSPCFTAFALRRTATDNVVGVNDDTVQTVLRNIYVDDLCRSCATVEEAKRIVSELRDLLEACRNELDWDESLDHLPGLEPSWEVWFEQLSQLEKISMRRNFVTNKRGRLVWCELHTFCDASTVGYGACSYLRCVYGDGSIEVNFVMGKSRVTPIKSMSVPRLELVAAVLGAKLNVKICNELDLIVNRVYYWTDALVVLLYIHNTSTRFEMFIANRLNVLHALTSVDQWKHIPGKLNLADIASRGLQPCQVRTLNSD